MDIDDFVIDSITSVSMTDKNGNSLMDKEQLSKDKKELSLGYDVRDLLLSSTIPLQCMHIEPFNKYCRDMSTNMCDRFEWEADVIKAETDEGLLWKMYGQISSYWLTNYENWYHREQYNFKKYRYEHRDDPCTFKI